MKLVNLYTRYCILCRDTIVYSVSNFVKLLAALAGKPVRISWFHVSIQTLCCSPVVVLHNAFYIE